MSRSGLLVAVLLLAGCGQKGPLYLPDKKPAAVTAAAASAAAPAATAPASVTPPAKKPTDEDAAQTPAPQ